MFALSAANPPRRWFTGEEHIDIKDDNTGVRKHFSRPYFMAKAYFLFIQIRGYSVI